MGGAGLCGRVVRLAQSVWWDGWASGRMVKSDVAIFPAAVGGWWSHAGKNVLVIHDKGLDFDRAFRLSSALTWPISVWFADVIMTPSEWTRDQIVARWPHAARKVVVIQWPSRLPPRTGDAKRWNPAQRPTVVMVSATEPHKDHALGIAVVQLARTVSGVDFALAIVGPRGRAERDVEARMKLSDPTGTWISRHVNLDEKELVQFLDNGFALLNTSKAEGFGLPLLEAAARDLPVVHSRLGSLNEVIELGGHESVTPLSLAYELTALLDPHNYRSAVERGRAAVDAHTSEQFAQEMIRLVTGGIER